MTFKCLTVRNRDLYNFCPVSAKIVREYFLAVYKIFFASLFWRRAAGSGGVFSVMAFL